LKISHPSLEPDPPPHAILASASDPSPFIVKQSSSHFRDFREAEYDWYFIKAKQWKEEYEKLRMIVLDCGLTEELKWGVPCYTFQKSNIVLIHGFKQYCALLFVKGALLKDANGILVQQTENVQAARQIRFTNAREILKMEPILKDYIHEAIEVEKARLKVD
jgi:uncharacterized protein YdeI (YjbR/CyaY-like superfamily)